jgi:hypothetical protein
MELGEWEEFGLLEDLPSAVSFLVRNHPSFARRGFKCAIQFSRGVLGFHCEPKAKTVQQGAETLQAGVTSLG